MFPEPAEDLIGFHALVIREVETDIDGMAFVRAARIAAALPSGSHCASIGLPGAARSSECTSPSLVAALWKK